MYSVRGRHRRLGGEVPEDKAKAPEEATDLPEATDNVKGQLILKANFEIFIWTKKWTKYFSISALALVKS